MAQDLETKVKTKLDSTGLLLIVTFFVLVMIMSLKASLLRADNVLTLQLALAVPLLFTSLTARLKLGNTENPTLWEQYGYLTYAIAFAFVLNSVGILLSYLSLNWVGVVFLIFTLLVTLLTFYFEYREKPYLLRALLYKDGILVVLLILGGLLHILRVY